MSEELRLAVEKAFVDAFAVFGTDPSFRLVRETDHVRTTSHTAEAFLNNVFELRSGLSPTRIAEIASHFHGHPFYWRLGPSNGKLLETARLLNSCGYVHIGATPGMILTGYRKPASVGLELKPVTDDAGLETWFLVWKRGFAMSAGGTRFNHALFANQRFHLNPAFRLVLGFHEGVPVACGNSYSKDGYVGLYNITVLPEWRQRGFGSALTGYLIEAAIDSKPGLVYVFCSPQGFSVYKCLGFETVCTLEQFTQGG